MTTKSELLNRLDNCSSQDEWENVYAAASVKLTHDDVYKIATSDKPYAKWFGFRFDTGPPGIPLPSFDAAIERMSKGVSSGGNALDAFQVIYSGRQLPNDFPPDEALKILNVCAVFALTNGPTNFATWLAARVGLASIALGRSELAWKLLNIPTADGQRHPNLQPLEFFEVLQGHPHLETNRLIQITIILQWPLLNVPLLPHLPTTSQYLESNPDDLSLQDTLDALAQAGAGHIAKLTLDTFTDWHNRQQTILDIQNREQKFVRPDVEKFQQEIRQIAHRLGDPHYLNLETIQRAVTDIKKPALSTAFLELAGISDGNPLEFLLQALSIRHFVSGTEYEDTWMPAALQMATDAVYEIGNPLFLPLRLELFNELIKNPSPYQSLPELYFQRAHTRAQITNLTADTTELTFNDYRQAIKLARNSKETDWLAAAIAGFCSYLSVIMLSRNADETYLRKEASDLLSEASMLELAPFRSAQIFLSRARISEPENAIKLLTQACDLLDHADRHRLSVGTELIAHILNAGDISSAIKTAQTLLDEATDIQECTELGELKLIYGHALTQARQFKDAERELKSALLSLRGQPSSPETNARLLLIDLLCRRNAWDDADEHLLQLKRPPTPLNEEQRIELTRLKNLLKSRPQTTNTPPVSSRPQKAAPQHRPQPTKTGFAQIIANSKNPAGSLFINISSRLASRTKNDLDPFGFLSAFTNKQKEKLYQNMAANSLAGQPEKIKAVLIELETIDMNAPKRPGALAARVLLLAHLARLGHGTTDDVTKAMDIALESLNELDNAAVCAFILRELASILSPDDHAQDPIRDFGRAASILRDVLALEGGEEHATDDTLVLLARALRYSKTGNLNSNLQEASRLYKNVCERRQNNGNCDLLANVLCNYAEVENQIFNGPQLERLQHCEAILEKALSSSQSGTTKADTQAMLAWQKTLVGRAMLPDKAGQEKLQDALKMFNSINKAAQTPRQHSYTEGNRVVCMAELALSTGDRHRVAEIYRTRLSQLDRQTQPYERATAMHNLASALLSNPQMTPENLAEGIQLCEEAAEFRTLHTNPRHHWETALLLGGTILQAMDPTSFVPAHGLPWPTSEIWNMALLWMRKALQAATNLGAGEELVMTAHEFWKFVSTAPTTKQAITVAEEAWSALRLASPYLLLHQQTREAEARFAHQVAAHLAYRLSDNKTATKNNVLHPSLAFILQGQIAEPALKWLRRGHVPLRRPLQARLQRPPSVPHQLWTQWQHLLQTKDHSGLTKTLQEIYRHAPNFLTEESSLKGTWHWLERHEGAVLINVVIASPISLVLIVFQDKDGQKQEYLLGLRVPKPPIDPTEFSVQMRGAAHNTQAVQTHNAAVQWAREHLAKPLLQFLEDTPKAIIWVPGPTLRLISPAAIWDKTPVLNALSMDLPHPDISSPKRRRSTLLVLADPGIKAGRLSLGPEGLNTLKTLAETAQKRGPFQQLASVGSKYGHALLGNSFDVRDTPASPKDILMEAGEHDTIVIIAHGSAENYSNAALSCVNAAGEIEPLDADALANAPDKFTGATIILLSCEGGQVGQGWAEPGGLAGTLISAGARYVIAPLWPVRLDLAAKAGTAILDGLTNGQQPWDVLATLTLADGGGPTLGPPRALSEQREQATLGSQAFVTWVG